MVTSFAGIAAIGTFPAGSAALPAARTPTATAAVNIVFLLAIVIAESFPRRAPRWDDWLIPFPV
jgi:hypothetical protein